MTDLQIPRPREAIDNREMLRALRAFKKGDFSVRFPSGLAGIDGQLAEAFNDVVRMSEAMTTEFARIRDEVGKEGRIDQRVTIPAASGSWVECIDSINVLIGDLVRPASEVARVMAAVAGGDLSNKVTAPASGGILEIKNSLNSMVGQLNAFASEVSRVAREVGTEGKLGGQAQVPGAAGIWKDLTDNVNLMAANVTNQVRGIASIASAVTKGDLDHKLVFEARGEIAALADTINGMIDHLSAFADQVAGIARRAGFEGRFGGQAKVSDVTGLWRRATDDVNRLAAHPAKLQNQKEELKRTNKRLEKDARQLSEQMKQVEYRNEEVELAKAALEEKAAQLALSARYKSEFLANMSHELRTPLNSLLILAQMLAENPASNLTPKQIEYAQTIYAAGNDLLALINDVLDLAKVESGTVTLNIATEPLPELRDYLDRAFRQVGHDKGLQFRISMQRDLPPAILTDAKRLRQILKNLLSNAFKFTPKGAVSLEIAMVTSGWTTGHPVLGEAREVMAFSVIDTGIGIAPDVQEIIFEAFQQADGTTSRQYGGTGLGLSISSKLSHLLGGEIKVQSSPGKGSTFTLYLPLVEKAEDRHRRKNDAGIDGDSLADRMPADPFQGSSQPVPDETTLFAPDEIGEALSGVDKMMPELAGRKVLLVDDDIRNIFALTTVLEEQGMKVMNAENGLNGIETLKNNPEIELILMDMMMPGLDGYDTIRAMRGLECFRGVPIIGVSAKAMKGDREKCIEAGASDYISKPVNVDHLISLIRTWLTR